VRVRHILARHRLLANEPSPINAYWTFPGAPLSKCDNDGEMMQIAGVVNTFAEFTLAVLPLLAVFSLRVNKRQRWNVISILCLGFFITFVGSVRTFFIWKAMTTYDYSWWSGPQWICSEVENSLAIVCSFLSPLYSCLFGKTD
jgi:hypothetical protein